MSSRWARELLAVLFLHYQSNHVLVRNDISLYELCHHRFLQLLPDTEASCALVVLVLSVMKPNIPPHPSFALVSGPECIQKSGSMVAQDLMCVVRGEQYRIVWV